MIRFCSFIHILVLSKHLSYSTSSSLGQMFTETPLSSISAVANAVPGSCDALDPGEDAELRVNIEWLLQHCNDNIFNKQPQCLDLCLLFGRQLCLQSLLSVASNHDNTEK